MSSVSARTAPGALGPGALRVARAFHRRFPLLREHRLEAYVSLVTVCGVAVIAFLVARDMRSPWPRWTPHDLVAFGVLAAFTLVSELVPIRIQRRGGVEEVTTSTTFAFAILLLWGTSLAVYVLAIVSTVADVSRRKPARKIFFNLGQYAVITAVAGGLFALLGGSHEADPVNVPALVVSAAGFFAANTFLTGVVVALSENTSIVAHVRGELVFNAGVATTLLAMSPVVALVAHRSVALELVFVLPVAAVQLAAKGSLERAALIEQLRGSLAHLTELNRAKDEFVAVVSHELRTPLTSVRGYISTLLRLHEELSDADERACLEAADRQSERLQHQIERLLFVASLETRRGRLGPNQPVSIPDLVRGIVTDMRPVLADHRVVFHVDEDLEPIMTDEASVSHIVTNLLENAAKYSAAGTEIDIDVRRQNDGVGLAVRDRGIGVPREHWERIFERFHQVDSSTTRTVGGTGLGLYITACCARDIGGRVWLERSDDRGSVFCVYAPSAPSEPPIETSSMDPWWTRPTAEGSLPAPLG